MNRPINVSLLPKLLSPEELCGSIAVMIDVLRASTTIAHSMAAGAKAIVPFQDIDAARRFASQHPETVLLGGERFGKRIEGFDIDNSAASYTSEIVAGQLIAFTTTNGTRALRHCANAERTIIGAFANLNSVLHFLLSADLPIQLVCAGTDGKITSEDCLVAGALILGVEISSNIPITMNDQASLVRDHYSAHSESPEMLVDAMRSGAGGRHLLQLGFGSDIVQASAWDTVDLVPEYIVETEQIISAKDFDPPQRPYLRPPPKFDSS